jgi:hypothetical protein
MSPGDWQLRITGHHAQKWSDKTAGQRELDNPQSPRRLTAQQYGRATQC